MHYPNRDIEEICYKEDHINQVLSQIRKNFPKYFNLYLETEADNRIIENEFKKMAKQFGSIKVTKKKIDSGIVLKDIIKEAIDSYNGDRQSYLEILDLNAINEYEDDPPSFKNTVLRNSCPIIRSTLQNRQAKELDKYRAEFNLADPKALLIVVRNLTTFAIHYLDNIYKESEYEKITKLDEMGLSELDEENYTVYGVIGGGIKSHFLYKLYPSVFPYRGRESIWALWFMTDKNTFGCTQDSEFLMINTNKNTTQQNFFYPYDLFSYYAYHIYLLLKNEYEKNGIKVDKTYRYVFVDSFLSFIANLYSEDIDVLKTALSEEGYGY